MSRPPHHSEHRPKQVPNYAQAAKTHSPQTQQQTRGGPQQPRQNSGDEPQGYHNNTNRLPANSSWQNYKNSYNKPKEYHNNNGYSYKKPSVQLPMTPNETAPIQFGSVNQPVTTNQRTNDIPVTKSEFGSVNDTTNHYRPRPPRQEIPRSPRNTNDGRLFTQSYAPRRDYNQGDTTAGAGGSGGNGGNGRYNNNNNNNNRYYNNNSGYNRNNNYVRPPPQTPQTPPSTTQPPLTTATSPVGAASHPVVPTSTNETNTATPIAPVTNSSNNTPQKPSHSPSTYHHHHVQVAYSPQQIPQQPQNLPPSPMSHRASPNMNPYTPKKTNPSPHMPHSSPQSIQMTSATWSPAGQYYYPHQYTVPVATFPVVATTNRPPIVPPPTTRKAIAIIDPATGTAVNTSPMSLNTTPHHPQLQKEEKHFEFKVPAVSKPVAIVDPAIRDRELREKKEREEAEQEAKRKEEEEKARKAQQEEEEKEREKQRLAQQEEEEQRRLQKEAEEKERAEQLEKERLEKERLAAAEALERQQKEQEEEMRRKAEEAESQPATNESDAPQEDRKKRQIKTIQDPSTIEYPVDIKAPSPKEGTQKHVYSIDFLLQFQQVCSDIPEDVSATIMREGVHIDSDANKLNMGSFAMRQPSDRGKNMPRTPGINTSNLHPDNMFKTGSRDGRMEMGKFNMGRPLTARSNSQYMERQGSVGRGSNMMNRGGRGGGSGGMKIIRNPPQQQQQQQPNGVSFEPIVPLEKSENRWVPSFGSSNAPTPSAEDELMPQEYIIRKVNALLNKLTLEKFDTITPKIFEYARQSAKEDDGRSLHTVMQLVFEKACDEPAFANMWARLCHYMYTSMTDDIRDVTLLNDQKKPSSGVLLFRKYLFNRCQQEFEKGWKINMPEVDEMDGVLSDEYYAAVKAKRQGLGLIQFIGELFKLDMLSDRIMYSCMTKLCNDPLNAGDEEAESLCKLLTTIGKTLDSKPKTVKWLDIIIDRMRKEMIHSPKLTSRVKFMIQDLLDLRKDKWVPRSASTQVGPTTIAKIHEMAEKAKEEKEAAMKRNNNSRGNYIPNNNNYNNMSRTGSYRNNKDTHFHHHSNNNNTNTTSDGWSTVSQSGNSIGNNSANKTRPNELSNFGKMDRSRSKISHLGPTNSPFAMLKNKSSSSMDINSANDGRSSSPATNMFSALENGSEQPEEKKKPHTLSETATPKLSDEVVKRKSKNILEEYFNIRDKNELVECVKELDDPSYLVIFVGEMLSVVEKKAQDVQDMCDTINYLSSEQLLEKNTLVAAFKSFMEGYDDLTIDVPQAPKYVAQLLAAASLSPEEVGGEEFGSLQNAYKAVVDSQA